MSNPGSASESVDILLVEDNPGDVRLTEEAFEHGQKANTLHVVNDGDDALDFLNRREEYADAPQPALVFLDLNLPRKNDAEVLAAVADDPSLTHIPMIVLTSSDAADDVVTSYERQANAYLRKPVDPEEFIEMVRICEEFWLSAARLPVSEDNP